MNSEQLSLADDWSASGEVVCADCLEAMREMPEGSVDAIVTDPPYGLGFMGVAWDTFNDGREGGHRTDATFDQVGGNHHPTCAADQARTRKSENVKFQGRMAPIFAEALRVAKPGAHLLCFGGTRTFHRMACAIEDAGWEIRDTIMWTFGSGFPKSMNVGKALAKAGHDTSAWDGFGTCLKPAWEPIIVARKPLDGTVAHNVMAHGTGALNIDACRVPIAADDETHAKNPHTRSKGKDSGIYGTYNAAEADWDATKGRFPANIVHDGSDEVVALFPQTGRSSGGNRHTRGNAGEEQTGVYGRYIKHRHDGERGVYNAFSEGDDTVTIGFDDSGSAARFFYCAKASKKERGEGNNHPTIKPLALMEWLVKLVTREGQLVLDPFAGSGTTLLACRKLGRRFVGIEREPEYVEIIERRLGGL